jgi:hypothetical protein
VVVSGYAERQRLREVCAGRKRVELQRQPDFIQSLRAVLEHAKP